MQSISKFDSLRDLEQKIQSLEERMLSKEQHYQQSLKHLELSQESQIESLRHHMQHCIKAKELELNKYRLQIAEVLETAQLVKQSLFDGRST